MVLFRGRAQDPSGRFGWLMTRRTEDTASLTLVAGEQAPEEETIGGCATFG